MAEPPATTSSTAATAAPDALLATKLHIPRTRPGFVARPRLVDRLAPAQAGELTLVCPRPASARPPCWPTGPERSPTGCLVVAG
jgi:hypothetical protein